ncbi:MAG TPA: putative O-glycosylation ligase, exosortase A system-associated [Casimicrobiaceae bacterium]|nr:putative O-glycosylation ligase, exosortase A system-associated [Casimicrobiaceae bacterium]
MRDYVFIPLIIGLSLAALRYPWVGVLAWTWLSIMNPHAYTWVAATLPLAAVVAACTLLGALISKERQPVFASAEARTLALLMIWMTAHFPFYFSAEGSFELWSKVMKIDLMILVTIAFLQTKRQIVLFVWVVVLSLGFFGVKGGIFTIATGNKSLVYGPGGFISGNNEIALALIMTIPLMRFVQLEAKRNWEKWGWAAAMVLSAAAALGSYSRGALVALIGMALYLWLKSPRKLVFGVGIVLAAFLVLPFMSERWETRMGTITDYETDSSASGRINAWWMTWNLAKDNFSGGGFDIYTKELFARYAPNPLDVHAAHSIYFQMLGEHGWIGLFLFLLLWWFVWRSAAWLIREGGQSEDTQWCRNLGAMCQVSLVGYALGGAFLSLAYFDLPYDVLAIVVVTKRWLLAHRLQAKTEPARDSNDRLAIRPLGHAP